MIARMALPRLGGAPAVWNSAMLVYQALLLAGYAYAHWLGLRPRRQVRSTSPLFALAAVGCRSACELGAVGRGATRSSGFLVAAPRSIGPLFFIVSAQAPLIQRWYALETGRGDPYPLYAASNLGSFAGLLSYPLLVEPLLPLSAQSWLWTGIYCALALLVALLCVGPAEARRRRRSRRTTCRRRPAVSLRTGSCSRRCRRG